MSDAAALLAAIRHQEVRMFYLEQSIGAGTVEGDETQVAIETTFEWPPEAVAEVRGLFFMLLRDRQTCAVKASYPGLLREPIDDPRARYRTQLIGARAQILIITQGGALLSFTSTGPFGDPERITGFSLGIVERGQHPLHFVFRVV